MYYRNKNSQIAKSRSTNKTSKGHWYGVGERLIAETKKGQRIGEVEIEDVSFDEDGVYALLVIYDNGKGSGIRRDLSLDENYVFSDGSKLRLTRLLLNEGKVFVKYRNHNGPKILREQYIPRSLG